MPKQVEELQNFNQGTVTTSSERDITPETAAYSLNLDPLTEDGKLIGVPEDRLVTSLSNNIFFQPLNYGLQWGASAIRIADLTQIPEATLDGEGSRIIFQGTRGINEILKYTSSYFDSSQIKDTLLNIEGGIGDGEVAGEISKNCTTLSVIGLSSKREGLIKDGDVIALSSETSSNNIPKTIEWMLVTSVDQISELITVERGHYNSEPVKYTSLSTNTNIYRLDGLLGWLNVSGWQTNFKNNHIGQNPCIIYVANAGATSADNLTHDAANKTITITQNSLVNNIGANDSLEDLVRNNDIIKIINASGGVATVKVDYVTDGVINYSSISGSLSTQTSGSYWIDCNKIANGNFRAYDTSADGKAPYGWTTTINPSGTATYDDVYADDTKSIGSPQLSTTGGITGLKGNERDTSNSNYDSTESPFLILSNARDTSIADVTLTDAIAKLETDNRFRVSNPALFSEGDTLVLSHGVGVKITDGGGDVYTGVDANPYLQNHYNPGYLYEALNVASFSDNETVVITIPSSIGGSGEDITLRFEDTSSGTLTTAGANRIISISNEDAAGANASDSQLAKNIVAAINGCPDPQRVTYGTSNGTGDTTTGVAGLSAAVNSETNTKVDIWPVNGVAEEYVKVESVEVSEDAGGDAQPGYINVKRAYHGNLQAHSAGTSIKRILRTQIKQTVGASGFDSVQEGKKYKLTWWVADVTKAWLGNNDYHLKPRLNFKIGCAGGYVLGGENWTSDKGLVGANGEKAWLNSANYTVTTDSNPKTEKGDLGGSIYHTWAGNKDITNSTATGWVRGVVSSRYQIGLNNLPKLASSISFVQDSGTTHNGNWTLGDASNENFSNVNGSSTYVETQPTALLHLSGAIHDKSIIGIPNTNGDQTYYAGWETALVTDSDGLSGETTETALNSNGSNPIRKAYIEFENFVGRMRGGERSEHHRNMDFFISSADGMYAQFTLPVHYRNETTNFRDGKTGRDYTTVSNATMWYGTADDNSQRYYRKYYLVPTDGAEVGAYKTLPTQISSGGTWAHDYVSDSMAGAVLATGVAYAKALKECIETAFNNYEGDGVTRFNVHRDGAKLCIEDAIGGTISNTWVSTFNGETLNTLTTNFANMYDLNYQSTEGKMHFVMRLNSKHINNWNPSAAYRWQNMVENNGQGDWDAGSSSHEGYLRGDGLGFNLGAITEGGGYTSEGSDANSICEFLTCYHIGAATADAAKGAANLKLAIEHANGQNGLITGNVANTDQLTLTRTDSVGLQTIDTARFPDRLEADSIITFSEGGVADVNFEFYTGVNNADTGSGKTILWHKCEFAFTLPDDKDISTLDVYFESDGEVWGTRDGGDIGETVIDKYSSLIGIDSISLVEDVEILPSIGVNSSISSSANIKDPEGDEILVYHDKENSTLNVIEDFGDPLDGHTNMFKNSEGIPFSAPSNIKPTFTKNNREFHIAMGPDKPSVWAGYLNHKQFGQDYNNTFIMEDSNIKTYDAQGAFSMDKISMAGFWLCELGTGAEYISAGKWRFYIPRSEHSLEVGDKLTAKGVSNKKTHANSGTHANINDNSIYDATCSYMYAHRTTSDSLIHGAPISAITDDYLELSTDNNSYLQNTLSTLSGDYAFQVFPPYHYGITRDSFNIYRISQETGEITKGELQFKAQSICASYSQSSENIGGTGSKHKGGRVFIAEKTTSLIHEINVATTKWENFTKSAVINPVWSTWWSSTERDASIEDVVVKEKPPTDRGHISDIIQTWGLKGSTDNLINEADSRLWIQFYPNSGNSFGPLDNFIYCGRADDLDGTTINDIHFCNRTIPLIHTGGGTQAMLDPHDRYGRSIDDLRGIGSNLGRANDTLDMKSRLIAKTKMKSISHSPNFTRNQWFTPEYINNWWDSDANADVKRPRELHFRRGNGTWEYDKAEAWAGGSGYRNYAENIGWDSDAPEFKVIRYGLVALSDNDFDGVIDGTGLPVASAANVNVGFENGKDCSSHAAAVLMQTDSKWIMNGSVAMALPFNSYYQEWRKTTMGVNHSGVGYNVDTFNKSVELFKPDTFLMVTSDIWKMEKADASSSHADNVNSNSKNAWIIPDTGSFGGKFSHASKSNTNSEGKLEHWSSSDVSDDNAIMLKDRVHLFRTADKHHLSIGNNIIFKPNAWRTEHASAVFGRDGIARSPEYGSLQPVVGIVDDYHFLINATHNGQGHGESASVTGTANHDYLGAGTYVENDGDYTGVGQDFLCWKVGGTEWNSSKAGTDIKEPRMHGGRVTIHDEKIEGSGMRFFSDGNVLGNFHFSDDESYYADDTHHRPQGVNVFQTSLLSFCHGRMIRPLGDLDVSGIGNFNIDNSISLFMPSMPLNTKPMRAYDLNNTYSYASKSLVCATKLYMSQREDDDTKIYTFDWGHIMPDANRATFEGVDYTETSRMYSSHRSYGTYELGDRTAEFRRLTTDMTHANMHSTNNHHESARGRFRLAGGRASQSADTGIDGTVRDASSSQNFMIPGGFMIKPGSDAWNGTMFEYDEVQQNKVGAAGIVLGGSATDLAKDNGLSLHRLNGSLFSTEYGDRNTFYIRKGALNDLIAVYSFTSPQRERKTLQTSTMFDRNNSNFRSEWALGLPRSVARKVISSYATTGGYGTLAAADSTIRGNLHTYFYGAWRDIVESDGDVHDILAPKGYDGNNMLARIDENLASWDNTSGEVFIRTHYPLPNAPGANAGESVTFIQSRDAALAPVRIDLDSLPAYYGYSSPGSKTPVRVQGLSGQIKILFGPPISPEHEEPHVNQVGVVGDGEGGESGDWENAKPIGENGETVKITGTQSYNGEYTIEGTQGNWTVIGPFNGNNGATEGGYVEFVGKGEKTNPILVKGFPGLILSNFSYGSTNNAASQLDNNSTESFYERMVAVSRGGKFKVGIIWKKFLSDFSLQQDYNYTSTKSKYYKSNENVSWHNTHITTYGSLIGGGSLFETEVNFVIRPGSAANSGNANFTSHADYRYKVSLVYDGYQEGPLSESEWPILDIDDNESYSDYDIELTIIDPPKRLTSVCLYRKNDENDLFRLVDEISTDNAQWISSNNSHTITIRDDGGLEATFESRTGYSEFLTNPFVNYGMGTSMSGYHFVANCSHPQIKDASHMIFRSIPGQFDLFNWANDFLTLPSKPTALANFAGRLYAFDEVNTYRINPETLVIEDTFHGSGCVGMESLIITDFGMFYCDRNNAYMHNGSTPDVISRSIKKGGGSDINDFNISDLSWEKTAGNNKSINPIVSFDNKRNAILFFVEKTGDEKVNHSRYYCWAYSILLSRWDLWEVSTGDNGAGIFDSSKVVSPSSVVTTTKGKTFLTMGDFIVDFLGGTNKKPWQFLSKKLTAGQQSQKKVWKNIKLIGNDDDMTTTVGDNKGSISIAIDDTVISGSNRTFTKDSPDGKVTIKGTSKTGRYMQFLLTEMESSVDAIGIVFRRKGVK